MLVVLDGLLDGGLLGGILEQKLQDMAGSQIGDQIIEWAVALALGTAAGGFAAGGEAFDIGAPEQVRGHGELAKQSGLALAQSQSGSAAESEYLSHY